MTEDHHSLFKENLAAYTIGALDSDESRPLEAHLSACAACRDELSGCQAVSAGLLSAVPPHAPPPALRKRLAERLPQTRKPGRAILAWPSLRLPFGPFATAAAIILLVGLNLFSTLQTHQLQRQQAEIARRLDTEQSAIAMLAYPGTQKITINEGVEGSLLLNTETNTAILFTWDLPELAEDENYQIWLIDKQGNRASGGLFVTHPDQAYTTIEVEPPAPLGNYIALGVTIEPWGGSPGPTGANALKVAF